MGLLDWFRTKKAVDHQPVNRIEELLARAAVDPTARPLFLNQLFHFDLLVLQPTDASVPSLLLIPHEEVPCALAFTSLEALQWYLAAYPPDTRVTEGRYAVLSAFDLFQMLKDRAGIILNYGHAFGKYFPPHQVREAVDGVRLEEKSTLTPAGTTIRVGQPAELPQELIACLARYADSAPFLREIYFGLFHRTDEGEPSYLVLLELREDADESRRAEILREFYQTIVDVPHSGIPVDFQFRDRLQEVEGAIEAGALKPLSTLRR